MQLYFVRHGLAGHASEWQGDDRERPLTDEGKDRMAKEARAMARLGVEPDLVLSSPLLRTMQTAEIVAKGLPNRPMVVECKRLKPGFGRKQLRKLLSKHEGHKSIMLVGHEPDFSTTIGRIIGGARVVCEKGSLVVVDVPDTADPKGTLVASVPPAVLVDYASGEKLPEPMNSRTHAEM